LVGRGRALQLLAAAALVVGALGWAETTTAQPKPLSVVYIESQPGLSEVWVNSVDGASKRKVAGVGRTARALDLRGSVLAVAVDRELVAVDLVSGAVKRTPVGDRISSAYVVDASSTFFTSHVGCGPVESKTVVGRFNATTGAVSKLALAEIEEWPGAEILSYNADADELTIAPRGCDPGVGELWTINATSGEKKSSVPVQGCGWAAVSPTGSQALISFAACGGGDFPELTVYGLPGGEPHEMRYAKDGPSEHPFVYAPDGSRAAYGLTLARGNPAGPGKSGGIWLLDTASYAESKLWQDEGKESWAIDWSPDGTKLLVASVEDENICAYSVIDVPSSKGTKVAGTDGCAMNGTMVGFANLP
jgi:hypothetical protein